MKAPNFSDIRDSFIAAAEKVLELAGANAFPRDLDTMGYQQLRRMFFGERAAMWVNGNRLLNYLKTEAPAMMEHLGVFSFPSVDEGRGRVSTVFGGSLATYAIAEKSRHKDAALRFLKSFTNLDAASEIVNELGDLPAVNHIPYEQYQSGLHGTLAKEMARADRILVHYFKCLDPHPAGVYMNVVSRLVAGATTAKEAFDTIEAAVRIEAKGEREAAGGSHDA